MHIKFSIISRVLYLVLLLILSFSAFTSVSAQTVQFNNNLYWNIQPIPHPEVKILQQFLKDQGFYTGDITGIYLAQTYESVMAFQTKYGISPVSGYFGPDTRVVANKILSGVTVATNVTPTVVSSPTPTPYAYPTPAVTTNTSVTSPVVAVYSPSSTNTTAPTQVSPIQTNLILNPSMETANGTKPDKWATGRWGTNTATFTYPTLGQDGNKASSVKITAYTSGDAKWYFNDIAVTPGAVYTFSEYYKSNVVTNVTVRWTKTDGTVAYQSLGNPAVATNWTLRTNIITVPANVKSMTIFHVLKSVGTLDIDNFKLVSGTGGGSTLTPIDATVSAWGSWTAVSTWSTCSAGTQSRTEERTRTITSSALNGGVTPSLKELRTVTQSCVTSNSGTGTPIPYPTPSVTPYATPYPTPATTPTTGTLNFPKKEWGAYAGWQEEALTQLENTIGAPAKYRAVFIHWGNEKNFPMYLKPYVKDKGKTLVIFWEATNYNVAGVNQANYSYDAILNGNFDSYFAQFVADAKAYGGEVILIPFSEMNGDWFPWSITKNNNSGQKHIDAWRRIREMFRGATNVKFGWAPNHDAVPDTAPNQFEKFYPGNEYVDYVGLDGFNFNYPWMTFDQIFKEGLTKMKAYNKPVFIFSFASAEGSQKASWINDALTVQIPKYPEIKGWIWFHENKERDWRINSDANSLNAFKSALPLTLPLGL